MDYDIEINKEDHFEESTSPRKMIEKVFDFFEISTSKLDKWAIIIPIETELGEIFILRTNIPEGDWNDIKKEYEIKRVSFVGHDTLILVSHHTDTYIVANELPNPIIAINKFPLSKGGGSVANSVGDAINSIHFIKSLSTNV